MGTSQAFLAKVSISSSLSIYIYISIYKIILIYLIILIIRIILKYKGGQFGLSSDSADLNDDGIPDLLVGSFAEIVYILYLDTVGRVLSHGKISSGLSGFDGSTHSDGDNFGFRLEILDDMNGDGFQEVLLNNPNKPDNPDNPVR